MKLGIGVFATADQLLKDYGEAEKKRGNVPWCRPSRCVRIPEDLPRLMYVIL